MRLRYSSEELRIITYYIEMRRNSVSTVISIIFFSLLQFSFSSFSQSIENKIEITCESADMHAGRFDSSWHCVINDAKQFRKEIGGKSDIDFSKYTLLGVTYSSGGCKSPTVTHTVSFLKDSNSYRYELNIQVNGLCEPLFTGNIWCIIPKIQTDSKVDFIRNVTH